MATLEKKEALSFMEEKQFRKDVGDKELTDIAVKRIWNASENGQRLIELKHLSKGTEKLLGSLRSRLYSQY